MKIIEHILHHTTDIGPHWTDLNNGGLTIASRPFNRAK